MLVLYSEESRHLRISVRLSVICQIYNWAVSNNIALPFSRPSADQVEDGHHTLLQGSDWNGQVKLGNGQFVGVNYLQSVTPNLSLGGEAFWLGQQRKSGAGFAARYVDKEHVATAQVATTGLVSLAYLRRLSEKVRFSASCHLHPSH